MLEQTIVILGGLGVFLAGHLRLLERYLDARLAQADTRITGLETSTNERFDRLETSTNERFDRLETSTNERFDRLEATINRRFDHLEAHVIRIEDTFLKDHGERIARLEALEHNN
jgi:hypothetical protein